jgi:lipoprotein signal peptidase
MTLLPLSLIIMIDQSSKQWASGLQEIKQFSLFTFEYQLNPGVFLGSLSELTPFTKNIVLTTVTILLMSAYLIVIFLVPIRSWVFKVAASMLVGGIISNTIDRFFTNYVVDFIKIEFSQQILIFNLADFFQIIAYLMMAVALFILPHFVETKRNERKQFIVDKNFQTKVSLLYSSITFLSSSVILVFAYVFFRENQKSITMLYFLSFGFALSMLLAICTFILFMYKTHSIAGPVFAIKKQLKDTLKGNLSIIKLRQDDEFKDIQEDLNKINTEYIKYKK